MGADVAGASAKLREKLLDLSRRNRLLNFRYTAQCVRIVDELPEEVFARLVSGESALRLAPWDRPAAAPGVELPAVSQAADRHSDDVLQTALDPASLAARCKKIAAAARLSLDEQGVGVLYLALGVVRWRESLSSDVTSDAPLLLVPVHLEGERNVWRLTWTTEDVEVNPTLQEYLRRSLGVTLPPFLEDEGVEAWFSAVAAELPATASLARQIVLGLLSFTKLRMYRDLDPAAWPDGAFAGHPVLRALLVGDEVENPPRADLPPILEDDPAIRDQRLILGADSSQRIVLDRVLRGESLVVEGPPGTGKSQTIANLIAGALAQDKTVLFVAEKAAALEVVHRRLVGAGLGDFCLDLHSVRGNRAAFVQSLRRRREGAWEPPPALPARRARLEEHRRAMVEVATLLSTPWGPTGEPVRALLAAAAERRRALRDGDPDVDIPAAALRDPAWAEAQREALRGLARSWKRQGQERLARWDGFSPVAIVPGQEEEVRAALNRAASVLDGIDGRLEAMEPLGRALPRELGAARALARARDVLRVRPPVVTEDRLARRELVKGSDLEHAETVLAEVAGWPSWARDADAARLSAVIDAESAWRGAGLSPDVDVGELAGLVTALEAARSCATRFRRWSSRAALAWPDAARALVADGPAAALALEPAISALAELAASPAGSPALGRSEARERARAYLATIADLEARRSDLERTFDLARAPSAAEMSTLASQVGRGVRAWFPCFSSELKQARERARRFVRNAAAVFSPELPARLEALAKWRSDVDAFDQNQDGSQDLGPAARGMSTDRRALVDAVEAGAAVRGWLGDDRAATRVIASVQADPALAVEGASALAAWRAAWATVVAAAPDAASSSFVDYDSRLLEVDERARAVLATGAAGNLGLAAREAARLLVRLPIRDAALADARWGRPGSIAGLAHEVAAMRQVFAWVGSRWSEAGVGDAWLGPGLGARLAALEAWSSLDQDLAVVRDLRRVLEPIGKFDPGRWLGGVDLATGASRLRERAENVHALPDVATVGRVGERLRSAGLGALIDALRAGSLEPDRLAVVFEARFALGIARALLERFPELREISGGQYEDLRERFRVLDDEVIRLNRQEVAAIVFRRAAPRGRASGKVSELSELGLIDHELNKQRRFLPLRQLVARASGALLALKPCFLMSPLSVAQYLAPGQVTFDLIVMDEASQIRPEDALGALLRGRQVVVVGDPRQMPPSDFFSALDPEESEDQVVAADSESVLDLCARVLPKDGLRFHYRSEHESLIAFSNRRFYDDRLLVFPSPRRPGPDLGVSCHYVEGARYVAGRSRGGNYNQREAEAVVAEVRARLLRGDAGSIGVVTFNGFQRDRILDLLDAAALAEPPLARALEEARAAEDSFFVKNLENVQGDERDVILISTTFGPEEGSGRVFQRFGPLAGIHGARRFNVLVTRARRVVHVITSLRPTDILVDETTSAGVSALRAYLEYASGSVSTPAIGATGRPPGSPFEEAVAAALVECGMTPVPQVGVAGFFVDLGVIHPAQPGEYLLGVECDGATFHSARSVRDRDRLRQDILERLGWRIHRVWSTDWFNRRDIEIERLKRAITEARAAQAPTRPVGAVPAAPTSGPIAVDLDRALRAFAASTLRGPDAALLADPIRAALVRHRPTTREAFLEVVPEPLRAPVPRTAWAYLDEVLEIVAESA